MTFFALKLMPVLLAMVQIRLEQFGAHGGCFGDCCGCCCPGSGGGGRGGGGKTVMGIPIPPVQGINAFETNWEIHMPSLPTWAGGQHVHTPTAAETILMRPPQNQKMTDIVNNGGVGGADDGINAAGREEEEISPAAAGNAYAGKQLHAFDAAAVLINEGQAPSNRGPKHNTTPTSTAKHSRGNISSDGSSGKATANMNMNDSDKKSENDDDNGQKKDAASNHHPHDLHHPKKLHVKKAEEGKKK